MPRRAHRIRDSSKNPRQRGGGFFMPWPLWPGLLCVLSDHRHELRSKPADRLRCDLRASQGPPRGQDHGHRCPPRRSRKHETAVKAIFRPSERFFHPGI